MHGPRCSTVVFSVVSGYQTCTIEVGLNRTATSGCYQQPSNSMPSGGCFDTPEGFAWVNAKLPECYLPSEAVFHSEPHLSTCKKVFAASGLVQNNVLSNAVKVKIMNPEDRPHKLCRGTKLGTLFGSPWNDYELVTDPFGEQQQNQEDAGVRICHASNTQAASTEEDHTFQELKTVFSEEADQWLSDTQHLSSIERQLLFQLILSYRDVFYMHEMDLGKTDLLKHQTELKQPTVILKENESILSHTTGLN